MTFVLFFLVFATSHASAASKDPTPDPAANPALASLIKGGAKFFYMGRGAGLDGWLAVKDGQIQIVYKPPSNAYVLVGYLFGPEGENLTSAQVKHLTATNQELAALAAVAPANDLPSTDASLSDALPRENPAVEALLKTAQDQALPPGERLMKTLDQAPGVTLGSNGKAPQIYVIAMPGCPSCKKFWDGFRDAAQKGAVRLRLYPVAPRGSDYEREAAQLFKASDPLAAWDAFTGNPASAAAGTPDPAALEQVRTDTDVSAQWKISAGPYLLYRGKDGGVKAVQGAPADPQAVLDDIALPPVGPAKP